LVGVYFDELRQQLGLSGGVTDDASVEEVPAPAPELAPVVEGEGADEAFNMELTNIDAAITQPVDGPSHHHSETAPNWNSTLPLSPAAKTHKAEEQAQLRLAMRQQGFPEIVAEIMRNTFYNLMQEAAFSEFAITAEPLQFAIKEKEKKRNNNSM